MDDRNTQYIPLCIRPWIRYLFRRIFILHGTTDTWSRDEDPVLAKNRIRCSNEVRFLKVYKTNILDDFKSLLVFILSVSRCTIDMMVQKTSPDPVKFGPDPGFKGLQGTSDTKYEIKKGLKNYLLYLFNRLLKISYVWGEEPWIFWPKPGPHPW